MNLKARTRAYGIYMALSILISLALASIIPVFMFFYALQNLDPVINGFGWPFQDIQVFVETQFVGAFPQFVFERFWFLILIVPVGMVCYSVFLTLLAAMFKLSRLAIPYIEDGYYTRDTDEWLLYEFRETYYVLFKHFIWLFAPYIDGRVRQVQFGAKIGKGTILGNSLVFTPERVDIGKNCYTGYGAIISGHVFEGRTLYLKPVKIGDNVTIGGYAIIMPGAEIGDNAIIGANAIVPKDRKIPAGTVWVNGKAAPLKGRQAEATIEASFHGLPEPVLIGNLDDNVEVLEEE
jgi:acetyltransferase-like isoleucine patch superfamily enzyme